MSAVLAVAMRTHYDMMGLRDKAEAVRTSRLHARSVSAGDLAARAARAEGGRGIEGGSGVT